MKKFFDKENFVFSSLDKKQKIQSIIVSSLILISFIFSAFTFFNGLYGFADAIGSIVSGSPDVALTDIVRSLPLFLSVFMSIWLLLFAHGFYRNADDKRRNKTLLKCSAALLAFGIVNVLFVVVGRFIGVYDSLVEGSPSPLYPLDSILYSLIFIAVGVCSMIYKFKFEEKYPYEVPSHGPIASKARFVYCFGVAIWLLVAIFSFADFVFGLFIIDFIHGYQFYSIVFLLVLLTNICFIAVWEFYYNELKEEKKKEFLLPLAIIGLGVSVLVAILYFVGLGMNLDGPSNVGNGVLPVGFAASVNIATLIVVFTPIIVSVVALIKGLIARKK